MTATGVAPGATGATGDLDLTAAIANVMTKEKADRAAERAAMAPVPPSRRQYVVAVLLGLVCLGTTAHALLDSPDVITVSPAAEARAARFQLWLASRNVDAFYDSAGVWPETVGAIGVDTGSVSYTRSVAGYVIAMSAGGRTWSHASGDTQSKAALDATADSVLQRNVR